MNNDIQRGEDEVKLPIEVSVSGSFEYGRHLKMIIKTSRSAGITAQLTAYVTGTRLVTTSSGGHVNYGVAPLLRLLFTEHFE